MSNKNKYEELGKAPVGKLLLQYATPAVVAMAATSLYNIIDGIFIGQGVGAEAIMGLAITMPLMSLTAAFGAMVGIGASTLMSIKLGEQDYEKSGTILGNVITLSFTMGLGLAILLLFYLDPILVFFGASDRTLPFARDFMQIILMGNVVTHLYYGLNALLRSTGRPKLAMNATIVTVLLNVILAPLFIYLFNWGIRGAALATVSSQTFVLLWQISLFSKKTELVHFKRGIYKLKKQIVKESLAIGLSPFLINLCACFVVIFVNQQMVKYGGDEAVGSYGIVNRLSLFIITIVIGLNQGLQPIAGYNFGARKFDRLLSVMKQATIAGTVVTSLGFILGFFMTYYCVRPFTDDQVLLEASMHGLKIMILSFPIIGFQIVTTGFFQCIGYAHISIFLSLTRQLLFFLPLLFIFPQFWGVEGVWIAMPVSDTLASILTFILLVYQLKKFKKMESQYIKK